eukprot:3044350-Alexandrium_andersonii.AAC.1
MSASLVGSEMCIRDRPRPPQWPPQGLAAPLAALAADAAFAAASAAFAACLLYTSDAADDM